MVNSYKTEIFNQLDKLDMEQQKKVLSFVDILTSNTPKGVEGKRLLPFAGTIESDDLKIMSQVIEEDCKKIDTNEW